MKKLKIKTRNFIKSALIQGLKEYDNEGSISKDDIINIFTIYVNNALPKFLNFNFTEFADTIINYCDSLKISNYNYRYSYSISKPNLYNSIYVLLLYFLLNKQDLITVNDKKQWVEYFNQFQQPDGTFIDPILESPFFYEGEWWGKRHIITHIITAYNYLGAKPKYEFEFIKQYYDETYLNNFFEHFESKNIRTTNDDNKLMNIGCILQAQRDFFNDSNADKALKLIYKKLSDCINPKYGAWGYGNHDDLIFLTDIVHYSYHINSILYYDKKYNTNIERLIDTILSIQTCVGGYGYKLNTSACDDIDAINQLYHLLKITDYRKKDILDSLKKAFIWVFANQNKDGGFVFSRSEPFQYGHELMSSKKDESHLFATWFRTLTIAYTAEALNMEHNFNIGSFPGTHFI